MNRPEYYRSEYLRLRTDIEKFYASSGAEVLFFS